MVRIIGSKKDLGQKFCPKNDLDQITKYIQKILIKNVGPTNTLVKINIDPKKRITPHPKGFVINFGKKN